MSADSRPVLFVTNLVAPDRVGAFAALHEREGIELALFGGRSAHATAGVAEPGVPWRAVRQRAVLSLAGSGAYRAVVCGTAGRVALPAAWAGARRAGEPFLLWSALWAPVRSAAGIAGEPFLRLIHRSAAAVLTYGPHVSAYARGLGARTTVVAPQAVDGAFWGAPGERTDRPPGFTAAFIGRDAPEKGAHVARAAWRASGLGDEGGRLVLVGGAAAGPDPSVTALGPQQPSGVRDVLSRSDVLLVPSLRTRTFREPWGLVINEAFHQGVPVIASDEVGAVAGGLVAHERNGLVTRAGDVTGTAVALRRLQADPATRARMGEAARRDVAPYTHEAWAAAFSRALGGCSRARTPC